MHQVQWMLIAVLFRVMIKQTMMLQQYHWLTVQLHCRTCLCLFWRTAMRQQWKRMYVPCIYQGWAQDVKARDQDAHTPRPRRWLHQPRRNVKISRPRRDVSSSRDVKVQVFTARSIYGSAVLGTVILSVCPLHACFVTKRKNILPIFWYHMKG